MLWKYMISFGVVKFRKLSQKVFFGLMIDGWIQYYRYLFTYCFVLMTVGKLPGAALLWFGRAPSKSKKGSNEKQKPILPTDSSLPFRNKPRPCQRIYACKICSPLLNMMPTDPSVLPLLCDREFSSRAQKNRPWSWLSSSSANNSRNCPVRFLHNCGVIQLESAPRLVQK